jgi:hypothetical protein
LAATLSILFGFTRAVRLVLPQRQKSKLYVIIKLFVLLLRPEIMFPIPLNSINKQRLFLVKRLFNQKSADPNQKM